MKKSPINSTQSLSNSSEFVCRNGQADPNVYGNRTKWKKKNNVGGSAQVYFETWYKCSEISSVDPMKGIWLMGQI